MYELDRLMNREIAKESKWDDAIIDEDYYLARVHSIEVDEVENTSRRE